MARLPVGATLGGVFKRYPIRSWEYHRFVNWLKEMANKGMYPWNDVRKWLEDPKKAPRAVIVEFRWSYRDDYIRPIEPEEVSAFKVWLEERGLSWWDYELVSENVKEILRAEFRLSQV